jgi:hypothetical protein
LVFGALGAAQLDPAWMARADVIEDITAGPVIALCSEQLVMRIGKPTTEHQGSNLSLPVVYCYIKPNDRITPRSR